MSMWSSSTRRRHFARRCGGRFFFWAGGSFRLPHRTRRSFQRRRYLRALRDEVSFRHPRSCRIRARSEYYSPAFKAERAANFEFVVRDPWKDRPVKKFQVVHEKLFHMFIVSRDLKFFLHDHPIFQEADGSFRYQATLPKPGMYRILGDFYPDGATPQLVAKTIFLPGPPSEPAHLTKDYSTKTDKNLHGGIGNRSAAADRPHEDHDVLQTESGRRPGKIRRRVGPHAGRERRRDRSDPHASVHRRRRPEHAVQRDLPASPYLSRVGAIPAPGRGEYGLLRRAGRRFTLGRVPARHCRSRTSR